MKTEEKENKQQRLEGDRQPDEQPDTYYDRGTSAEPEQDEHIQLQGIEHMAVVPVSQVKCSKLCLDSPTVANSLVIAVTLQWERLQHCKAGKTGSIVHTDTRVPVTRIQSASFRQGPEHGLVGVVFKRLKLKMFKSNYCKIVTVLHNAFHCLLNRSYGICDVKCDTRKKMRKNIKENLFAGNGNGVH
ncbi:hypothetical protein F2P81_004447 [Scophthalmus maximus]|uniref:Uncharacterized protein n=1 Tax=Scophthalmus maximus TaxID=52904 RepID=A0A6A4TH71_SCOMX|nr:hypothetical protein F2P81_004447 [Scophthalmus maximus]